MSTISGVSSGTSAAWSDVKAARAARQEKMFAKVDTDGSGSVDKTELQATLDKVAEKTGTTARKADDVMAKLDTDGNGTLDQSELRAGVKSLLQAPSSTHDFVQQHVSPDSDPISQAPTSAQLDTDGNTDSSIGQLDTTKDGVAPTQEHAAGDLKGVLANLLKAIDSNGDKKVSASEVDTFQKNVAAALQTLAASTGTSAASGTTAATSANTSGDSSSDSSSSSSSTSANGSTDAASSTGSRRHHSDFSLSAFANLVLKQYASNAGATSSTPSSVNTSA